MKLPISEKTNKMLFAAREALNNFPLHIEEQNNEILEINKYIEILHEQYAKTIRDFEKIKDIIEFNIFTMFLLTDIATLIRLFYSKEQNDYEQKYALRQFIVLENEGFKRIYHFTQGDKTHHRNKSLWISLIKPIVEKEIPELQEEYAEITKNLDALSVILQNSQVSRRFFVHYFEERNTPSDLWSEICKINTVSVFNALTPFIILLKNISDFLFKILSEYKKTSDIESQKTTKEMNDKIEYMEKILKENNIDPKNLSLDWYKRLANLK